MIIEARYLSVGDVFEVPTTGQHGTVLALDKGVESTALYGPPIMVTVNGGFRFELPRAMEVLIIKQGS